MMTDRENKERNSCMLTSNSKIALEVISGITGL